MTTAFSQQIPVFSVTFTKIVNSVFADTVGAEAPTAYVSLFDSADTDSERATTRHKTKSTEINLFFTCFSLFSCCLFVYQLCSGLDLGSAGAVFSYRCEVSFNSSSTGEDCVEYSEILSIDLAVSVYVCSCIVLVEEDEGVDSESVAHLETVYAVDIEEISELNGNRVRTVLEALNSSTVLINYVRSVVPTKNVGNITNLKESCTGSGGGNLELESYEVLAALDCNVCVVSLSCDVNDTSLDGNHLTGLAIHDLSLNVACEASVELGILVEGGLLGEVLENFRVVGKCEVETPNIYAVERSEVESYGDDGAHGSNFRISSVYCSGNENFKTLILHGSSFTLVATSCARLLACLVTVLSVVNYNGYRSGMVVLVDTLDIGYGAETAVLTELDGVALVYAGSGNNFFSSVVVSDLDGLFTNYADAILNGSVVTLGGELLTSLVNVSAGCGDVVIEVLESTEGALPVLVVELGVVVVSGRGVRLLYDSGLTGKGIGVLKLLVSESSVVSLVALNGAVSLDNELGTIGKGNGDLLAFEYSSLSSKLDNYFFAGLLVLIYAVNFELTASCAVLNVCNAVDLTGCNGAGYDVLPCVSILNNSVRSRSGLIGVGLATLCTLLVGYLRAVGGLSLESGTTLVDYSGLESGLSSVSVLNVRSVAECTYGVSDDTGLVTGCSLTSYVLSLDVALDTGLYIYSSATDGAAVNIIRGDGAVSCRGSNGLAERISRLTIAVGVSNITLSIGVLECDAVEYFCLSLALKHNLRVSVDEVAVYGNSTNRTLGSDSGGPCSKSGGSLSTVMGLNGELHLVTCSRLLVNFKVGVTAVIAEPYVYNTHITCSTGKFLSVVNLLTVVHYIRLVLAVSGSILNLNDPVVELAVLGYCDCSLSSNGAVLVAAESVNSALGCAGSVYGLGNSLVSGCGNGLNPVLAASLAEQILVTDGGTSRLGGKTVLSLDVLVLLLYNLFLANFASVGVVTANELIGTLLNLVAALVGDDNVLRVDLIDLYVLLILKDIELMAVITLVDSVRTVLGTVVSNCSLNEGLVLALAIYVKNINSLGILAVLAGVESGAGNVLAVNPSRLGNYLGELPGMLVGLLFATDRALVELLTADAGDLIPLVRILPLCGLNSGFATYATLLVGLTIGLGSAVYRHVLAVLVVGVVNPLVAGSLGAKIVSKLLAALVTLVCSVRRIGTGCINFAKHCVFTVLDSVYSRAISVIGDSREYGRRYERHYHDCCQNERKNLFHVFFPFEKYNFLGPSCHAFDKILCLPRWLDTMLAAPAYQASIDTLRHSITSRKILYTTFCFLSIPFEKIYSKKQKKLSVFILSPSSIPNYGIFFVFCSQAVFSHLTR